jgi:hypothetical protein
MYKNTMGEPSPPVAPGAFRNMDYLTYNILRYISFCTFIEIIPCKARLKDLWTELLI